MQTSSLRQAKFYLLLGLSLILILAACSQQGSPALPNETLTHSVYLDVDQDNSLSSADAPLTDITVSLFSADGKALERSTTNATGIASFSAIPEESYFTYGVPESKSGTHELACTVLGYSSLCHYETLTDLTQQVDLSAISTQTNNTYLIRSLSSGKCLSVANSGQANATNINQYSCNGETNQQWQLQHLGNSVYRLSAAHSGKVLDVSGVSQDDGANIHQWQWLNAGNQKWSITLSGNAYRLRAQHSGKCLDVYASSQANNGNVIQWSCHNFNNQKWTFLKVNPNPQPEPTQDLISFALVNAETNVLVPGFEDLSKANTIDLAKVDLKQYSVIAKINSDHPNARFVESVSFDSTIVKRTENVVPYALFGDSSGNYSGRDIQEGNYSIKATAYSQNQARGNRLGEESVSFSVIKTVTPDPEPEPDPQFIANDIYNITASHSGLCLSVKNGSQDNDAFVEQLSCSGAIGQTWELSHLGNNVYKIIATHSDKGLDIYKNKATQYRFDGSSNQKFEAIKQGDRFELRPLSSDLCLSVPNSSQANVQLVEESCVGADNQRFQFKAPIDPEPNPDPDPDPEPTAKIENGPYTLKASHSNKCLSVESASQNNDAAVIQRSCDGARDQTWQITNLGDDSYKLIVKHSLKGLDVFEQEVTQYSYDGSSNQVFKAVKQGDAFEFRPLSSNLCITVPNASQEDIQLVEASCQDQASQRFIVELVQADPDPDPEPNPDLGDYGQKARVYLNAIATGIGPRNSGTAQEKEAATYFENELKSFGYTTQVQTFQTKDPSAEIFSQNIIATKAGKSSKELIIGAHLDNGNGDGAEDNASGLSVILEIAERIKDIETPYSLRIIGFGSEETGKEGSNFYVNNMSDAEIQNTLNIIILDSILSGDFTYVYGDEGERGFIRNFLLDNVSSLGINGIITQEGLNSDYPAGTTGPFSDQVPFVNVGIPYTYFEATNWTIGNLDGFTQFDPAKGGRDGRIFNTEFDTVDYIESIFPGRINAHLALYAKTLFEVLTNDLPIPNDLVIAPQALSLQSWSTTPTSR